MNIITLSEDEWNWLMNMLDRPIQDMPKLNDLFNRPSPWSDNDLP